MNEGIRTRSAFSGKMYPGRTEMIDGPLVVNVEKAISVSDGFIDSY